MEGVATITNSAIATDGGSILLLGFDGAGAPRRVFLDLSIASTRAGKQALSVNDVVVQIGSADESEWLRVLRTATIRYESMRPVNGAAVVDELVRFVIERVSSPEYHCQRGEIPPWTPQEEIRVLLSEGREHDAIRVYRRAHPEVGLAQASAAVKAMKLK